MSKLNVVFVIAIIANSSGCIAVQYPSRKRQQDYDAGKKIRQLVLLQKRYHETNGSYAQTIPTLQLSMQSRSELNRPDGCLAGYCYSIKLTAGGFELYAKPERAGESGYRSFYVDQSGVLRFTTQSRYANSTDPSLE